MVASRVASNPASLPTAFVGLALRRCTQSTLGPALDTNLTPWEVARAKASIGRRIFRAVSRFFVAVLIGVGATLGWQSHADEVKEIVRTWAPSLSWLLPVPTEMPAAAATPSKPLQRLE